MRTRLMHYWDILTSGYWFVPAAMVVLAVTAAFILIAVDRTLDGTHVGWLYSGGVEGAQTLLSTVAGSVITVAGVTFSITIAALTQASNQFGPRLLRNFMRDTGNKVVLGTFVATFAYCLLVLRSIHGKMDYGGPFVPVASVTFGMVVAGASIVVLIYFIHHISISLQAPTVVAAAARELQIVIDQSSDEHIGSSVKSSADAVAGLPESFERDAFTITATSEGYLQAVDYDGLMEAAVNWNLVLRLAYRPGDFIIKGSDLLQAWPGDACPPECSKQLNEAFICGQQGTNEQDLEYGVGQIVQIAVRALSPAINDPFTAINCIDVLGAAVCRIARAGLPGPLRFDKQGKLRLVAPVTTFEGFTDAAFNQIRQYGRDSASVCIHLLDVIANCATQMTTKVQRDCLMHHANMIEQDSRGSISQGHDLTEVHARWQAAIKALGG